MNNSIFSLQKRLLAIYVLVASIFFLIVVRLAYIQLIKSSWLQAKAVEQWTRDLPIQAKRGSILDANGVELAVSYSTYDVYVRPSRVKNPQQVSLLLSNVLGLDYETTLSKVLNKNVSEVIIKLQVDNGKAEKIIKENLSGILLSENNTRYYPYEDLASQVIGFTTIDNQGQAGLEAYYNQYLRGVEGYALEESDVNGVKIDNSLDLYIPSIDGFSIKLTLDLKIQKSLDIALEKCMLEQKPKTASGIVMNAKTGEIVAMGSKPSVNLNNPDRSNVQELMQNIKNLSIVDVYEPGSTFKVLTMASALDVGVAKLEDRFYDPGYVVVDGDRIKCWKHTGHGSQTLTEGLCNSCNTVFVDLALRLGKDKIYSYFEKYGLGNSLGVDFFGESSGILMDKDSAKTVDLARMGFGQAIAVTPLQLITATCSVLNGGNLMKPYLVKNIYDVEGNIIYENFPTLINKTVSSDTSEKIKVMFEEVVKNFTGIESFIPGYRVGGKTGTTQKYENGKISGKYIASFIGGFPANDPDYVILIIADEPGMGNYYGSVVATPYAKLIFQDIITYKNYLPTEIGEEEKMIRNIEMPNLVGKSLSEASSILISLGLQYQIAGEGLFVISQTPPPKTYVYKNSIVILTTE